MHGSELHFRDRALLLGVSECRLRRVLRRCELGHGDTAHRRRPLALESEARLDLAKRLLRPRLVGDDTEDDELWRKALRSA